MSKLPALHFYVGDWMKSPDVRVLSYAARGLWIDMLCLMHESPRRGYLQHPSGRPVSAEQLSRMTGGTVDQVEELLQELGEAGVYSRQKGTIFSRRMVRDERKRKLCSDAGKRGGGSPTFKGGSKGAHKGQAKGALEDEDEKKETKSLSEYPEALRTEVFDVAWSEWLTYRKERKQSVTPSTKAKQLKQLAAMGVEKAVASINQSIEKGWQGLFEVNDGRTANHSGGGSGSGRAANPARAVDTRDSFNFPSRDAAELLAE